MGVRNYYRDMWQRRSHTLAPLTKLTSIKINFKWKQVGKDDFDKIKRIVACDTLLTSPDSNETFKIHTNGSTFQLGAVISQKGKPIAFYSRKMTDSPKRYKVTERERLSIVKTLKEFRTMLLSQKLRIYNDHKNIMCRIFNYDRVLRWRLILEEYGPDTEDIKGEKNIVVDIISIIPLNGNKETTKKSTYQQEILSEINDI